MPNGVKSKNVIDAFHIIGRSVVVYKLYIYYYYQYSYDIFYINTNINISGRGGQILPTF